MLRVFVFLHLDDLIPSPIPPPPCFVFHGPRSFRSMSQGSDLMNLTAYPTNHRLVSSLSSGKLVAVVSSSDLQLMKGLGQGGESGKEGGGMTRSRSGSYIY